MYFIGSDSDILAWLFADTPKVAFANGVLYTLVEGARANELDVYEYLKYLLTETPNNHHLEDPSVIDSLLPGQKNCQSSPTLVSDLVMYPGMFFTAGNLLDSVKFPL